MSFNLSKDAFRSLGKLGVRRVYVQVYIYTSYEPNLIADSGITLTTFKPLPGMHRQSKPVEGRLEHLPAYRLRMPPACHSSLVAVASGLQAFMAAFTMLPCFAATTASSATLVCAMR